MQANLFSSSTLRIIPFFFISLLGLNSTAQAKETWVLEKVVEVSRHGVRPMTTSARQSIEKGINRELPSWGTPDGDLTPHGAAAVTIKGIYEGKYYRRIHFLPDSCPTTSEVYIWASPLERTEATAKALASSMFPNCDVPVYAERTKNNLSTGNDTLFHPMKSGYLHADRTFAEQQSLQAMGQDPQAFLAQYFNDIDYLSKAVCTPQKACPLFDQIKKDRSLKQILKDINVLSDLAETIQLTYNQGMPMNQIVLNHAEDIGRLIALQPLKYVVSQDIPYIAQQDSSTLMHLIQTALTQGTDIEQKKENVTAMDARYLLFVGHDTNISQLRTLLHFNWQLGRYPKGNIPPAGSLVFERWLNTSTQQRYLHVYFQTQGLDQIRNLQPITNDNPMLKAEWQPAESIKTPNGYMLPFNYAMSFIETQVDTSAIIPVKLPVRIH